MSGTQTLREQKTAVAPEEIRQPWYMEGEPEKDDDGQQTQSFPLANKASTRRALKNTAYFPSTEVPASTEVILHWWIGEVQEVYDDYFAARMVDVDGEESLVEFDLSEVRKEDQDRVEVGAAFTFTVTRQDRRDGRRRVSEIVFLEPYRWTAQDEERAIRLVHEHFPESADLDI